MSSPTFFNRITEQSKVKVNIVTKYFAAWAHVIIPSAKKHDNKIAYIDLYSGPGKYDDGTDSTPLVILKQAVKDNDLREMLVTHFNDKIPAFGERLKENIDAIEGIETLKYRPSINNDSIGSDFSKIFQEMHLIPSLIFIDPWGYKGLSLDLIRAVLKDWGCDVIFFFNYRRINMILNNPNMIDHTNNIFGRERAEQLRSDLRGLNTIERQNQIISALTEGVIAIGGQFVLPFTFFNDRGTRVCHHLVFVSKIFKGYEIMKSIMANHSSYIENGVSSFKFNPQPKLFDVKQTLRDLEISLLDQYSGKNMKMEEIYLQHNVGTNYIKKNYKQALKNLLDAKKIKANLPTRRGIFPDRVVVKFN